MEKLGVNLLPEGSIFLTQDLPACVAALRLPVEWESGSRHRNPLEERSIHLRRGKGHLSL